MRGSFTRRITAGNGVLVGTRGPGAFDSHRRRLTMDSRIAGDMVSLWHRKMNNMDERASMPIHSLPISEIVRDTALQPRAQLDSAIIQEYAERIKAGDKFPPLDVWDTPEGMLLSSGFHRVAAYESAGVKKVECEVHQGTRRDAIWHALGENKTHGLKRTNADKRRAVELALSDEEWRKRSDRSIAEYLGVSNFTVSTIRKEIQLLDSNSSEPQTRIGADGKERRLPVLPPKPVETTQGNQLRNSEVDEDDEDDAPLDDFIDPPIPEESETDTDLEDEPEEESPSRDGMHPWAREVFADLSEFEKIRREINDLQKRVKALAMERKGVWIHSQTVCSDLGNAKRGVVQCRPFAACPYCKGKGCLQCRKSGHVTKAMYESTPPEKKT